MSLPSPPIPLAAARQAFVLDLAPLLAVQTALPRPLSTLFHSLAPPFHLFAALFGLLPAQVLSLPAALIATSLPRRLRPVPGFSPFALAPITFAPVTFAPVTFAPVLAVPFPPVLTIPEIGWRFANVEPAAAVLS